MSKNYLILGASSDVGIELLKEINSKDHSSVIWAHYFSNDEAIKKIKKENDNNIIPIAADFSNMKDVEHLYSIIEKSGMIPTSIVHLSAPKLQYDKFRNLRWEDCVCDTHIQVGSIFRLLQMLLPRITKMEYRAKIVFMLSENTVNLPSKFTTKYTMSKYMLLGLMKSLASEYEGKNVNINALSPSMINTKFLDKIDKRTLEIYSDIDCILEPREVVPWILKLLSEFSDDMNGANILFTGEENGIEQ